MDSPSWIFTQQARPKMKTISSISSGRTTRSSSFTILASEGTNINTQCMHCAYCSGCMFPLKQDTLSYCAFYKGYIGHNIVYNQDTLSYCTEYKVIVTHLNKHITYLVLPWIWLLDCFTDIPLQWCFQYWYVTSFDRHRGKKTKSPILANTIRKYKI